MSQRESAGTRAPATSERRPVTILFTDIVGSTAIVERMDPEDWMTIVGEAFARLNRTVERFDGTVARLMGDGLLAFFGAPVAHEDDPERAVRCGLELVRAIDEYVREVGPAHGIELRVRVGINTGPVVVGTVGTDVAHEYTAMGDAVNVAARIEAAARPGAVLVTAETYRFVAPLVEATDVGPLELKGKAAPVRAYEVMRLRAGATTTRGLAGLQAPMVGRDAELAALRATFAVSAKGQGRMALVIGEPGIGKTRLLSELRAEVTRTTPGAHWIETRAVSYGQALAYGIVGDLVRTMVGVGTTAADEQLRGALARTTQELLGEAWPEAYAYLGHLLSLELEPEQRARISSLEREVTKRYGASLVLLLRAAVLRGPTVLVLEDLHWADAASTDVLLQVIPLVGEVPLLCVATTRPERDAAGWRLVSYVRDVFADALVDVRLQPLSGDEARTLVSGLLAIESLPAATCDLILAKAEGNPFFVEEVVRVLIDRGAIVRDGERWVATPGVAAVEIPDTLQGLLLARIDRLTPEAKRTLRVASVIGRQFGVRILERLLEATTVSGRPELAQLEARGLVQIAAFEPELEYLFRHALVQDAAYASLLKQDRRALHRHAAETLLAFYPDRVRANAAVIALHFERAEEPEPAATHYLIAGDHALERFANREALAAFERVLALLPVEERFATDRLRAALGATRAGVTFVPLDVSLARLEQTLAAADGVAEKRLVGDGYFWVAFLRRRRGEMPESSAELRKATDRASEIGAELGDPVAQAIPQAFMGMGMTITGQLRDGARLLEAALPVMAEKGEPLSAAIVGDVLAATYARLGEWAAAERAIGVAERLAATGDPIARLDAMIARSIIELERGAIREGMATARRCAADAEELGAVTCSLSSNLNLGQGHLELDEAASARAPLQRGHELSLVANLPPLRVLAQGLLSSAEGSLGDQAAAVRGWDEALAAGHAIGDRLHEATIRWTRARVAARREPPDHRAALEDLDAARALFEAMEAQPALARVLRDRAESLRPLGRAEEAARSAEEAERIAAALGLTDFPPP